MAFLRTARGVRRGANIFSPDSVCRVLIGVTTNPLMLGRAIGTYMYLPAVPTSGGVALLAVDGSATATAAVDVYSMGSAYA